MCVSLRLQFSSNREDCTVEEGVNETIDLNR